MDPRTGVYSEALADACDLAFLRKSSDWQKVRTRPKSFVEKLLVLNESERLTGKQALEHEWFSNEVHKANFDELYQRTIKHWRPRPVRRDVVEFRDATIVQSLLFPRRSNFDRSRRSRDVDPIDAHCQPVPRSMFSTFWPRRSRGSNKRAEQLKESRSSWPSKERSRAVPGDLDDMEEEELHSHRTKRQDLTGPEQSRPSSRSHRANSAPPRLTDSPYFTPAKPNVSRQRLAVEKPSPGKPVGARDQPSLATHRLLDRPTALIKAKALNQVSIFTTTKKQPQSATPLRSKAANAAAQPPWTPNSPGHALVAQSLLPMQAKARQGNLSQEESHTIEASESEELSKTPVHTDRLRRWASSPLQSSVSSRSSVKRRRGSIFDIEEGDNAAMSPSVKREAKRMKKVHFSGEALASNDDDQTAEDEVTLPHRPTKLGVSGCGGASGLYLPR